ncbi:hypothetical protein FIBSPDRAFT_903246 [Athelia psychrophila]|uniref:Uncharacterized protein n=1 Tax=Athelia psychrophila TaxID=1759441 RepID=A0A167W8H0_9AGAM|nr:hypothetical protein FIBSPDRAFT_903246 [Fibularhizoctonia sp. CBS 109695]
MHHNSRLTPALWLGQATPADPCALAVTASCKCLPQIHHHSKLTPALWLGQTVADPCTLAGTGCCKYLPQIHHRSRLTPALWLWQPNSCYILPFSSQGGKYHEASPPGPTEQPVFIITLDLSFFIWDKTYSKKCFLQALSIYEDAATNHNAVMKAVMAACRMKEGDSDKEQEAFRARMMDIVLTHRLCYEPSNPILCIALAIYASLRRARPQPKYRSSEANDGPSAISRAVMVHSIEPEEIAHGRRSRGPYWRRSHWLKRQHCNGGSELLTAWFSSASYISCVVEVAAIPMYSGPKMVNALEPLAG